ncbi:MAG TPA: MauE/DoxX family redox-associated membrane protein [Bryobacteraceae bacterium]|nr:MauE/DoxX family redox-associated membrane protein [Bryobacteraceae bacterium]
MEDSIAHPPLRAGAFELPAWKSVVNVAAALLLAILFVVAGVWKITDPLSASARMIQAKVPADLSLAAAILLGIAETFGGVLLVVPRFRRWGAWLTGGLLVVFMIYIGVHYNALRGEECSCFPWIKRAVGPGFFIGDAVMLLFAFMAGYWARQPESKRSAAIILGAVSVFALASYGVIYARQTGLKAPDAITVDGQPASLQHGRIFLYFFDPECSHCIEAGQRLAKLNWKDTKVIGIPTAQPRFAKAFLNDTGLKAGISNDLELLRQTFKFVAGPFAVALENGRQKEAFNNFDQEHPAKDLRSLGFVD